MKKMLSVAEILQRGRAVDNIIVFKMGDILIPWLLASADGKNQTIDIDDVLRAFDIK